MAIDLSSSLGIGQASPAWHAAIITPGSGPLPFVTRGLWIGGAGNVNLITAGGETLTFANVSGVLPLRVVEVLTAGTTATDIVGLW